MMSNRIVLLLFVATGLSLFMGCDPERKKKCEWYLMPEPNLAGTTTEGYIPVCARNLENNKQYCRLQATLEFSKKYYNKRFKFVDMKIDESGRFPKTVQSIKTCN